MLRILHTGDWHLDSPFSHLDAKRAAQRQRELRATFQTMIDYADRNGVDLVLAAGDIFDREYVTLDTVYDFQILDNDQLLLSKLSDTNNLYFKREKDQARLDYFTKYDNFATAIQYGYISKALD